jgi:RNA polymerase sigma-70 factor (ECF subfamily)
MKLAMRIDGDLRVHFFDFARELHRIHDCWNVCPSHDGLLSANSVDMPIRRSGRRPRRNGSSGTISRAARLWNGGAVTISKDDFETQVLAILGPLRGVARRLTNNEANADDLVAESITRAWRARASLADAGAFRAWIFRILNNTFISERRKVAARPREEPMVDESGDAEGAFSIFERLHQPFLLWFGNPEQEFLDKLLREDLERALAALPEHYRIVVVLADVEGLKYGEIAEALDVPVGTVRSRLARARSALQRTLWTVARDRGLQTPRAAGTHG